MRTINPRLPLVFLKVGHMRTNKACPLYAGGGPMPGTSSSAVLTDQEEEEETAMRLDLPDDEELINVDGTKIKLSGKVIKVRGRGREGVSDGSLLNNRPFSRI